MDQHDITLPLSHKSGAPAIIKAKLMVDEKDLKPAWVLPGGVITNNRKAAEKEGMKIFKAAGWK